MNIYEEGIRKFVRMNKKLIVEELPTKGLGLEQLKSTWGGRFGKIAKQSLKENEFMLDFDQIDWKDLIDEGIQATASIAEQKIRQKRSKATYEAFDTETDLVASQIRKRQLETSQSEQKAERRKIWYDNEEKTTSPASSNYFTDKRTEDSDLVEELPNHTSVRSITEDNEAVEVIYNESSLWLSGGSSYIPETNTEPSLPNIRLRLSGLFSSVDYEPQPISVGYVAEQAIFSPLTTQNINILTSAMQSNELLRLDHNYTTMEELAINHILTDVYLKHSTSKYREDSELSLLIDSISCLFSSLWSSHSTVRLTWDKTSLTASANSPSSISFRPDIIFSTKLSNGQEYEIGNGEVKAPSVKKCIVDATRVRVLETAKRQLHKRMRISSAHNTLVTFGILIRGFSFEVYIVRYVDGYYPYEKITWGELPRFNKVNGVLTHALRSMLTLKHSMELSLADIDTNDNNPDGLIESNLLPTVSYTMIYKEAIPYPSEHLLDHSHLKPGSNASLLSYTQTINMYRKNLKRTNNMETQCDFAIFLVEAAKHIDEQNNDNRQGYLLEAKRLLKKIAARGHYESQYYLANSAKHHHADAAYRAAQYYENGLGTKRTRQKQLFIIAAILNHPGAMYRIGLAAIKGELSLSRNTRDGYKWLNRSAEAANAQYPHALHELAQLYENGLDSTVFVDTNYSIHLYHEAATLGYAPSAYRLGECYKLGKLGCVKNPALSVYYYTIAAEQGHSLSCIALASWCLVGIPGILSSSEEQAYHYTLVAARAGLPKAEYALGYFTELGIGTAQDLSLALHWYRTAAGHGDMRAIDRLRQQELQVMVKEQVKKTSSLSMQSDPSSFKNKLWLLRKFQK
ncbi:hypothetical protein G6F62_000925 [Rhizopus arrhizus]|nr:hypothetical protein G6F22_005491 [Rhizopus arrhizus]KAG0796059.1 hypothetical protein G6F21_001605 [Rhizopus arrhizus]KAG0817750.1 hypothetical protein G6F20_002141 [Rhizopus arrhizus]KAG0843472.1 hypothetical protein G6F19_000454 [Rhizopus arrhizus]KAG0844227.1 hypothetical protein G6F18_002068 [Rhizopus arrhizus]